MPICNKRKIVFIHIPRCGGSMIEKALGIYKNDYPKVHEDILFGRKDNRELQHLTYDEVSSIRDVSNYESFAIVRDPIDRFISVCNRRRSIFLESNEISYYIKLASYCIAENNYKNELCHFKPQCNFVDKSTVLFSFPNFKGVFEFLNLPTSLIRVDNKSPNFFSKSDLSSSDLNFLYSLYKKDHLLFTKIINGEPLKQ